MTEGGSKRKRFDITPDTRVGELLDVYPGLEETLVAMAPPFAKLRNPLLRKTVAKVTTLRQAAKVGGVPLADLINTLRKASGATDETFQESGQDASLVNIERPEWLQEARITRRLDARPLIEAGERPVGRIMPELERLGKGDIFELTTPFVPAPIIDMAKEKGFSVWHEEVVAELVRTYFRR